MSEERVDSRNEAATRTFFSQQTKGEPRLVSGSGAKMVETRKRLHRNIIKLSVAAIAFGSFGAAVVAEPFLAHPVVVAKTEVGALQSLASGPSIQLAKAGPGESEDCVRVTRMVGPDGKEYPTRGVVCGND